MVNCGVCDPAFVLRVNLRGHNASMQTVMYVILIFHGELRKEDLLGAGP